MGKPVIEKGSTHHAYQFTGMIKLSLERLATRTRLDKGSDLEVLFKEFVEHTTFSAKEFEVLMAKSTKNAQKNEHHCLVVSDFWESFMRGVRQLRSLDYKKLSELFVLEVCSVSDLLAQEWLGTFHIHFISFKKMPYDLSGWKEEIIADHNSDHSHIRTSAFYLWELEGGKYPYVGFIPVDPRVLAVKYQTKRGASA